SSQEAALVIGRFHTGTCMVGGAVCTENGSCGANGPCVGAGYTPLPTTVNTALHTATTSGVTSFSTLAVVHPDALAGTFKLPLVPGGGPVTTDCPAEWQGVHPATPAVPRQAGLPERDPGLHRRRPGMRCRSDRRRHLHVPGEHLPRSGGPEPAGLHRLRLDRLPGA